MRLACLLLSALALGAQQSPRTMPWVEAEALPWRPLAQTEVCAPGADTAREGSLRVDLSPDGTLKVSDAKGLVLLRAGLPGRPLKAWRDDGRPLPSPSGAWFFAPETPLKTGVAALPLGKPDFRPGFGGLLWVMDDGEQYLTVLHPATLQIAYLPLPAARSLDLAFCPQQLQVRSSEGADRGANPGWCISWSALLPQFIRLGMPPPPRKPGTALVPFPNE